MRTLEGLTRVLLQVRLEGADVARREAAHVAQQVALCAVPQHVRLLRVTPLEGAPALGARESAVERSLQNN